MITDTDVIAVLNRRLRVLRGTGEWLLQRPRSTGNWITFAGSRAKVSLHMHIRDELRRNKHKPGLPLDQLARRYTDADAWAEIEALPDFFPQENP